MFAEERGILETIGCGGYHVMSQLDHVTSSCSPIGQPGSLLVLSNRVWEFCDHCNATCSGHPRARLQPGSCVRLHLVISVCSERTPSPGERGEIISQKYYKNIVENISPYMEIIFPFLNPTATTSERCSLITHIFVPSSQLLPEH